MIARAAASVIVAGALLLGASGCSFFAPQATLIHYEPSDGTAATIGDIAVRNVIALSTDGKTANLIMTIINSGDVPRLVNFQYEDVQGAKQTIGISVQRNSSTPVGYSSDDKAVVMTNLYSKVGGLVPVYIQYGNEPGTQMLVPVLDGTQPQFATLVPTPAPTK